MEPFTKKSIKIRFGVPVPVEAKDKKGKVSKVKAPAGPQKYYVAKYNLMLGHSTFLKDAIIIATLK